jgi:hypothetical protein
MDIRYSGGADGESDLVLSDCPDEQENKMGYLSQLLEWHEQDPPDERERLRNDKACENWQGNRNVFIDYPELVDLLFGSPRDLIGEGAGYECTLDPPPGEDDGSGGVNASCATLRSGDIMTTQISSDDPDLVAFVAMTDLPAGLKLFVTDNAWTGSSFRDNEGTIMVRSMYCVTWLRLCALVAHSSVFYSLRFRAEVLPTERYLDMGRV